METQVIQGLEGQPQDSGQVNKPKQKKVPLTKLSDLMMTLEEAAAMAGNEQTLPQQVTQQASQAQQVYQTNTQPQLQQAQPLQATQPQPQQHEQQPTIKFDLKKYLQDQIHSFAKSQVVRDSLLHLLNKRDIMQCEPSSIVAAIQTAALLDLNPLLDEIYFIVYDKKISAQISYQGYIKMAAECGVESISSRCVFEGDEFEVSFSPFDLKHKPNLANANKVDKLLYVYAMGKYKGEVIFELLTKEDIERLRQLNFAVRANRHTAWDIAYFEMAEIKAIRKLLKRFKVLPNEIDVNEFNSTN